MRSIFTLNLLVALAWQVVPARVGVWAKATNGESEVERERPMGPTRVGNGGRNGCHKCSAVYEIGELDLGNREWFLLMQMLFMLYSLGSVGVHS